MEDRFKRGIIAGIVAGVVMNAIDYLSFHFGFSNLRYLDFAALFTYGRFPVNVMEAAFAQIFQFIFTMFLSIVFSYMISKILTSRSILLKGWFYGVISWFLIYAFTIALGVPELEQISFGTAVSNLVTSSVYGLILAQALYWMEYRNGVRT